MWVILVENLWDVSFFIIVNFCFYLKFVLIKERMSFFIIEMLRFDGENWEKFGIKFFED